MATPRPCKEPGCDRPKWAPLHRCYWHALLELPIDEQIGYAEKREAKARAVDGFTERPRVAAAEWPEGTRWCSGCQWFVPVFYTQGSRCKACGSKAAYSSYLKSEYNITYDDYKAMYDWQGGRCYICRRAPKKKRLAIDHDHVTGEVRGLLCADSDRGCNHAILGNITSLDMARRIVSYLENPPLKMIRAGQRAPVEVAAAKPQVQGKVHGSKPNPEENFGPWADGVEVGTMDIMRALGAREGLNAAGERVQKGSRDDLITWRGQNTPPEAPQQPVTAPADLDAQWDALTL
jgi:hypothetical protein